MGRERIVRILICERQAPVRARQAGEGADEGEEDEEEGDIGAQGADEEDQGDKGQEEEEEGEAGIEGGSLQAEGVTRIACLRGDFGGVGNVRSVGIEPGDKGGG